MLIDSGSVCLTLPPMLYQQIARAQLDTTIVTEHTDQKLLEQAPRQLGEHSSIQDY
jgi:hypothetical protein